MTFERGLLVRVKNPHSAPQGILADADHLAARRAENALGEVITVQGGDPLLIWVRHGHGALAPYWEHELAVVGGRDVEL